MEADLKDHIAYFPKVFPDSLVFYERLRTEVRWAPKMWTNGPLPRLCCHSVQEYPVGAIVVKWLQNFFQVNLGCKMELLDVFGNYYRNGNDYLPQHPDDYSRPGVEVHVVSISFGTKRRFTFNNGRRGKVVASYALESGDVIVFDPYMNKHYTHGIAKRDTIKTGRINMTCFVTFEGLPYGKKIKGGVSSVDEMFALEMQSNEWLE